MGDIAAQLAGCLLGRDLTAELADKYGVATFERAVELILDQSEAAARAFIRAMPDGVYAAETFLDNDRSGDDAGADQGQGDRRGRRADGRLFRASPAQAKGPINSGYFGGGQTTARVAFKYLLGAGEMANEGTFRPIKLDPAAGQAPQRRPDRADVHVSDAVSDRDRRHHQGAGEGAAGARAGRPFRHPFGRALLRPARRTARSSTPTTAAMAAGAPARPMTAPARSAPWRMATPASSRSSCRKRMLPFRIEEFSLREDSAGAGKFRGGLGFRKTYRMLAPCNLRHQSRPHQVSALGRAGRQGGASPAASPSSRRATGERASVDKENAYRARSPATWSASRPAAAAAMGRRRSARSS